jgi:dihydroorotate dehydrogenase (NAD+) catalytic subunit
MSPFYDPSKSYEENYDNGPFGEWASGSTSGVTSDTAGAQTYELWGHKLTTPFGIPAGPLLNSKFVSAAFKAGFDVCVYKTVRSREHASHPWPNVLPVTIKGGDLKQEEADAGVTSKEQYDEPLSITNSFGVPSKSPDVWQGDMAAALSAAAPGQLMIGSFQGTQDGSGNFDNYQADFVTTAKLVKETGVQVMEVNLSCPNEGTSDLLCYDIARTQAIAFAIKNAIGNTPLIIKIGYYADDEKLKQLVAEVGNTVDGIAAINTIAAKIITPQGEQALPGQGRARSGVCGAAIKWAGLEMVERLDKWRKAGNHTFKIIGVGGVLSSDDVKTYLSAGADAAMSATGAMWNPNLGKQVREAL